jgi:hypothetical protein
MGDRNTWTYRILKRIHFVKCPLRRQRRRWRVTVRQILREIACVDGKWKELAQGRVQCRNLVASWRSKTIGFWYYGVIQAKTTHFRRVFPKLYFSGGPLLTSKNKHRSSHPFSLKLSVRTTGIEN